MKDFGLAGPVRSVPSIDTLSDRPTRMCQSN